VIVRCTASALIIRSLPVINEGTDTGKRFIRDQTALAYGDCEKDWIYVDAPAGRGWVAKAHVDEEVEFISPAWPSVPTGRTAVEALYGKPGNALCYAGRATLPASLPLSWQPATKITVFACHKLIEDVFTSFFKQIFDRQLWALLEDFGGCYNYRVVRGSTNVSTHAYGIGIDINTKSNALGKPPKMDQRIVAIGDDHGLLWGGNWNRPDGMHFQRARGI
jgi:hypothetical protein